MSRFSKTIAYSGAALIGFSDSVSVVFPLYLFWFESELTLAVALGIVINLVDGYSSYSLNGRSIIESEQYEDDSEEDSQEQRQPLIEPAQHGCDCNTSASMSVQAVMQLLTLAIILGNRSLLVYNLTEQFSAEFSWPFKLLIAVSTIISTTFCASNEDLEAQQSISGYFKRPNRMLNQYWLMPFSGPKARAGLRAVGSFEHSLMDDILPWIALIPKDAIDYLKSHPVLGGILLGVLTLVGIPLALVFLVCTWLFQGKNTEQHLSQIYQARSLVSTNVMVNQYSATSLLTMSVAPASETRISTSTARHLRRLLNLMGPAHGASAAAPVVIMLRYFINADLLTRAFSVWGSGLSVLVVVGLYVHFSEVRGAKKELDELTDDSDDGDFLPDAFTPHNNMM